MKLSDKRYEQIKEIVVNMFENYEITCVPINGFEIASKMGILVVPYTKPGQFKTFYPQRRNKNEM